MTLSVMILVIVALFTGSKMSRRLTINCAECGAVVNIIEGSTDERGVGVLVCTCSNSQCMAGSGWECAYGHVTNPSNICGLDPEPVIKASGAGIKLRCLCGSLATVKRKNPLAPGIYTLYCSCSNRECGCRFVCSLNQSKRIVPSAASTESLIHHLLSACPADVLRTITRSLEDLKPI